MKKILLSLGVAAIFVVYTITQRNQGSSLVLKPSSPAGQNSRGSTTASTNNSGTSSSSNGSISGTGMATSGQYKDGTYTGQPADAFYGLINVAVTISGGKITAVNFLQYPNDNPNSIEINDQAMPYLQQETIQAQSANVNIISGATDTSQAFVQSLSSALSQAM